MRYDNIIFFYLILVSINNNKKNETKKSIKLTKNKNIKR